MLLINTRNAKNHPAIHSYRSKRIGPKTTKIVAFKNHKIFINSVIPDCIVVDKSITSTFKEWETCKFEDMY